jgi:hypothetical protein
LLIKCKDRRVFEVCLYFFSAHFKDNAFFSRSIKEILDIDHAALLRQLRLQIFRCLTFCFYILMLINVLLELLQQFQFLIKSFILLIHIFMFPILSNMNQPLLLSSPIKEACLIVKKDPKGSICQPIPDPILSRVIDPSLNQRLPVWLLLL